MTTTEQQQRIGALYAMASHLVSPGGNASRRPMAEKLRNSSYVQALQLARKLGLKIPPNW